MNDENQKFNPMVSIIIPVYNGSNFVEEAINSALAQTYDNIEVIVVNDGSDDNNQTELIARQYGDKIRYFSKPNGGVSSALNLGIEKMNGDYFSWLSHDDKYTESKIEFQIKELRNLNDEVKMVYCGSTQIDKNSVEIKNLYRGAELPNKAYTWEEALMIMFKNGAYNGCGFLIQKDIILEAGGFDEELKYCQDFYMWCKIFLNKHGFLYSNYIGVESRLHNNQLTRTGIDLFHDDCKLMSETLAPKLAEISNKDESFLLSYAKRNAKQNNSAVVRNCFISAEKNNLFSLTDKLSIRALLLYGKIRPLIRRIYHKVFNRVKTK